MYIRIRPHLSSCDCKPPRSKKQEASGQNFSDTYVPGNWESGLLIKRSSWELQFCCSLMDPCSFILSGFVWLIWNTRTRNEPNARQNSIQILTSMRNVHSAKKNSIRIQTYASSVKSRKATTHWPHLITEEQMCSILCVYWLDFRAKKQQERCYMVSINLLSGNIPIMTSASGMHLASQYCS
jgi:hypothetical protein